MAADAEVIQLEIALSPAMQDLRQGTCLKLLAMCFHIACNC